MLKGRALLRGGSNCGEATLSSAMLDRDSSLTYKSCPRQLSREEEEEENCYTVVLLVFAPLAFLA